MVGTKRRLPAEERKTKTLARVTRVFARKGFAGTTSAELARAAGVSEALLYKLFGSKRRLYQAMIQHKLETAGWGEFPVNVSPETSEQVFFAGMAEAIFAKVEADPDFVRLLIYSDLQGSEFAELFHEARGSSVLAAVSDYLRGRLESGALRDVDPDLAGLSFLCMVWQYAIGTKVFKSKGLPEISDALVIETMVSIFVRGLQV
ncbi:MAG: TetR/AcrR family transcriptional regulator [Planctomycetes bacterium]|nr:TetR/AcrR family transcriptional regulator [Planctomycetota bacterium]